jgi:hypothetical protein
VLVDAHIVARLLGMKILKLDAAVVMAPAKVQHASDGGGRRSEISLSQTGILLDARKLLHQADDALADSRH